MEVQATAAPTVGGGEPSGGDRGAPHDGAAAPPASLPVAALPRAAISEHYELGRFIGRGKFSQVYRATRRADGAAVALKRIALEAAGVPLDDDTVGKIMRELTLVRALDHVNVVRFEDAFVDPGGGDGDDSGGDTNGGGGGGGGAELVLAFEYADAGDLKRQLRKARDKGARFDERIVWRYFAQLADGVAHMHARRVIHRDLKPANVFLTTAGVVKIGDLGLGRLLPEGDLLAARSRVGTPLYMSPEVLCGLPHGPPADVWSLGCILYELAATLSPFKEEGLTLVRLFDKIAGAGRHGYGRDGGGGGGAHAADGTAGGGGGAGAPEDAVSPPYPPLPPVYSPELRGLVDAMLCRDPARRPDMGEVCRVAHAMHARLAVAARVQQHQQQQPQHSAVLAAASDAPPSRLSSRAPSPVPSSGAGAGTAVHAVAPSPSAESSTGAAPHEVSATGSSSPGASSGGGGGRGLLRVGSGFLQPPSPASASMVVAPSPSVGEQTLALSAAVGAVARADRFDFTSGGADASPPAAAAPATTARRRPVTSSPPAALPPRARPAAATHLPVSAAASAPTSAPPADAVAGRATGIATTGIRAVASARPVPPTSQVPLHSAQSLSRQSLSRQSLSRSDSNCCVGDAASPHGLRGPYSAAMGIDFVGQHGNPADDGDDDGRLLTRQLTAGSASADSGAGGGLGGADFGAEPRPGAAPLQPLSVAPPPLGERRHLLSSSGGDGAGSSLAFATPSTAASSVTLGGSTSVAAATAGATADIAATPVSSAYGIFARAKRKLLGLPAAAAAVDGGADNPGSAVATPTAARILSGYKTASLLPFAAPPPPLPVAVGMIRAGSARASSRPVGGGGASSGDDGSARPPPPLASASGGASGRSRPSASAAGSSGGGGDGAPLTAHGTPTPVPPSSVSAAWLSGASGGGGAGGGAGAHAAQVPLPQLQTLPPPASQQLHPAVAVSPLYANTLLLETLVRAGLYDDAACNAAGGDGGAGVEERAVLAAALSDPTFFAVARRVPEAAGAAAAAATTTSRVGRPAAGVGGGVQLPPRAQLLGALVVAAGLLRLCSGGSGGGAGGLRGLAALTASGQLHPHDAARELVGALAVTRLLPEAVLAAAAAAPPDAVAQGYGPLVLSLLLHLGDAAVARGAGGQPSYRRATAGGAVDDDDDARGDAVAEDDEDDYEAGDDSGEPRGEAAGGYGGGRDDTQPAGGLLPPLPTPTTDPQRWHAECERQRPRLEGIDRDLLLVATTAGTGTGTPALAAAAPASLSGRGSSKWRQHVAAAQAAAALLTSSGRDGASVALQSQPPRSQPLQSFLLPTAPMAAPLSAADVRRGLQELSRACAAAVDGVRAAEARVDALLLHGGRAAGSGSGSGGGGGASTSAAVALLRRYRDASTRLAAARREAALRQAAVGDLTAQYHAVGERLEEVADAIAARTAAGGGAAQLATLRAALSALRAESRALDVRLGLLGHSVMQARIAAGERDRRAAAVGAAQQQRAALYGGGHSAGGY